jgi:hypothetical protein
MRILGIHNGGGVGSRCRLLFQEHKPNLSHLEGIRGMQNDLPKVRGGGLKAHKAVCWASH